MKTRSTSLLATALFSCANAFLTAPVARAWESGEITAMSGRVSEDYIRTQLPDGSFQPETFAFGEGGHQSGPARDDTIDHLTFRQIAHLLAPSLTNQKYITATDPKQTKLLIMVYWGTTVGSADDPDVLLTYGAEGMLTFNSQRARDDFKNARLLGYDSGGLPGIDYPPFHQRTMDLLDEIQDDRYFVVLMAYDFQLLWKEKKRKLLWETRISVREARNDFTLAVPAMAQIASRYFGHDSNGLIHRSLHESIKLHELRFIGFGPGSSLGAPTEETGGKPAASLTPHTPLPPALAERIANYQREKDALQEALEAKIKAQPSDRENEKTIDHFNRENAPQIAGLKKQREAIRTDLGNLPLPQPIATDGDKSMEKFLAGLADDVRHNVMFSPAQKP